MPEIYEDWCENKRNEHQERYFSILKKLASHYFEKGEYHKSLEFWKKALNCNKFDESVYQGMMRCYMRTSDRKSALATYETLKNLLEKELSAVPSSESAQLFQKILNSLE